MADNIQISKELEYQIQTLLESEVTLIKSETSKLQICYNIISYTIYTLIFIVCISLFRLVPSLDKWNIEFTCGIFFFVCWIILFLILIATVIGLVFWRGKIKTKIVKENIERLNHISEKKIDEEKYLMIFMTASVVPKAERNELKIKYKTYEEVVRLSHKMQEELKKP